MAHREEYIRGMPLVTTTADLKMDASHYYSVIGILKQGIIHLMGCVG